MLDIGLALLLTLLAITAWMANILGLPGNWAIVLMAGGCAWWGPEDRFWTISFYMAGAILAVALIGEALEFAASAVGASRLGGSKRGVVLSIVGSICGAIVGLSLAQRFQSWKCDCVAVAGSIGSICWRDAG